MRKVRRRKRIVQLCRQRASTFFSAPGKYGTTGPCTRPLHKTMFVFALPVGIFNCNFHLDHFLFDYSLLI
ncbi:uncharacterized protein METZ01_LOCUS463710 [marine metagenome]|uniref:Uncharacterized protein n=1 Tax=marine metagenome TaxID=408172 RepID=A0A383ASE0_9ZZZZ